MQRIRFLGPLDDLEELLGLLQDLEVVHLGAGRRDGDLESVTLSDRQRRRLGQLRSILEDCEAVLEAVGRKPEGRPAPSVSLPRAAKLVRRLRRRTDEMTGERELLDREREELERYAQILDVFGPLLTEVESELVAHQLLLLRKGADREADRIEAELARLTNESFALRRKELPSGELAVLVLVSRGMSDSVARLWRRSGIEEIPPPQSLGGADARGARERIGDRLDEISRRLDEIASKLDTVALEHGATLQVTRTRIHDLLQTLSSLPRARRTRHAFVLDAWVPEAALARVRRRIAEAFESRVALEVLEREEWRGDPVPVVLSNPAIFRPFEALIRPFPLPRYGTLDPTPFVAVFFPMFFGLILGDIGYGLLLGLAGLVLRTISVGPGLRRDIAHIALSCAAFTVIFGFLYGELFGDLGHRYLGLEPVLFDRGEAVLPFLGLAVALGFVHLLLGLTVAAAAAWRGDRKEALGRGVAALMVLGSGAALLVALGVLPAPLFTPLVIALLALFPILIFLEGLAAPIELLSTLGHVLSYARIMAIGTASVMLAVVANRMVGALGSVAVGAVFALLFHLVNFALGVFSPTIHALRLHYVEFFGTFYSPGGTRYDPLTHWRPKPDGPH